MNGKSIGAKISPAINKFCQLEFIRCMQQGCTAALSVVIIGSIFNLLKNPPYTEGMTNGFMNLWKSFSTAHGSWLGLGYSFSMDMLGLYVCIATVIALTSIHKKKPTNYIIISLCCFFLLCCPIQEKNLVMTYLSSQGMFPAIIIGYLSTKLLMLFQDKGFNIKLPEAVPESIAEPLNSMFANLATVAVFLVIYLVTAQLGTTVPDLIYALFKPLFVAADTLPAIILYVLFMRVLWFFGIHGDSVGKAVMRPILIANAAENAAAVAAGEAIPHIVSQAFNYWTYMPVFAMVVAMMIVAKSSQMKTISKVALVPGFFNVSEPVVFGFPLVLNFQLLIPHLLVYVLDVAVPYLLYAAGFMTIPYLTVIGTMPCPLLAYLTSFDIKNVLVYLVLFAVNVLILLPSFRKYDRSLLEKEQSENKEAAQA